MSVLHAQEVSNDRPVPRTPSVLFRKVPLAEEDPCRVLVGWDESGASQGSFQSSLRRILFGAIVVGCILGCVQMGALQNQWHAEAMMQRISSHDRQFARSLQEVSSTSALSPAYGLLISHVHIDITDQDGVTVDMDVPIEVENNMSGSFQHNKGANSSTGDVHRLEGVFMDNCFGKPGPCGATMAGQGAGQGAGNVSHVTVSTELAENTAEKVSNVTKKTLDGIHGARAKVESKITQEKEKEARDVEKRKAKKNRKDESSDKAYKITEKTSEKTLPFAGKETFALASSIRDPVGPTFDFLSDSSKKAMTAPTKMEDEFMKPLPQLLTASKPKDILSDSSKKAMTAPTKMEDEFMKPLTPISAASKSAVAKDPDHDPTNSKSKSEGSKDSDDGSTDSKSKSKGSKNSDDGSTDSKSKSDGPTTYIHKPSAREDIKLARKYHQFKKKVKKLKKDISEMREGTEAVADFMGAGNTENQTVDGPSEYEEILEALVKAAAKGRPVVVENVHVHVKKQRGFQASFATDIDVSDDMPATFRYNTGANSKKGDVVRMNGVANGNLIT